MNLLESKVDPSRSKYKIRSRFIFVPRGYSISNNPGKNITSQRRQESIGLDVLAVNKQIRQEAGSIFYSRLFNLRCSPETALAFLGERPAWALDHITRVAIVHRTAASDTGRKAWRELCKFIRKQLHLKELHFLCDRPFWRHWYQPDDEIEDWTELSGVDWIRPLIKITGLAKLTVRLSSTYDYFVCCHHNPEPAERHDVLDALLRSKMLEEDGEFVGWRESKKNRRCSICRATRDE